MPLNRPSDITDGLSQRPARISPKYFYDQRGSQLFEAITRLPEYYPTRTETALMQRHAADMTRHLGAVRTVIELGAGSCEKARALCAWVRPACFVGVDISVDFLQEAVLRLRADMPGLDARAVGGDMTQGVVLPSDIPRAGRLVFYPGSSIGNFDPTQALELLRHMRALVDGDGGLLIGIDLPKDVAVLEAAYDDAAGVTAAFNRNVLTHLNRLIGSDFVEDQWGHRVEHLRALAGWRAPVCHGRAHPHRKQLQIPPCRVHRHAGPGGFLPCAGMDRRAGLVCRGARPPLNPLLERCLAMNLLISRYTEVRRHTTGLVQPLSPEDCTAQSMPDASPAKWHLAHTTWFFETFVLEAHEPGFAPFAPAFRVLFNSYYNGVGARHPRAQRGLITRPSLAEVDARMLHLLSTPGQDAALCALVELGLQHEQQHQELLVTDIQHLLSSNPMHPVYRAPQSLAADEGAAPQWYSDSFFGREFAPNAAKAMRPKP